MLSDQQLSVGSSSPAPSPAPRSSPWLTTREAAARVRLHPKVLLRKRAAGQLGDVRTGSNGRDLLWHVEDLDAWLQGECP